MRNIYGETVKLTAAQRRAYVALLEGPIFVQSTSRQNATFAALCRKNLVTVSRALANGCQYKRWI